MRRVVLVLIAAAVFGAAVDDPDHVRKLEDFPVQKRVHSLALDPKAHRVYTPEQDENGTPVARMVVYDAVTEREPND